MYFFCNEKKSKTDYTVTCIISQSQMMLTELPTDLWIEITKFLSLKEVLNLRHILRCFKDSTQVTGYTEPVIYLFRNSCIYLKPNLVSNIPILHVYNCKILFNMLKYSSLNSTDVYNTLYYIDQDLITKDNKYKICIKYKLTDINQQRIINTIKLVQIMLQMIEHRFDENNIINNPYCFVYSTLNNILIDYFCDVAEQKYNTKANRQVTTKFRYMIIYENSWYKFNINLYVIFILYLINLDIISKKHLKEIRKNIKCGLCIMDSNYYDIKHPIYDTNLMYLFNYNDSMAIAYSIMFDKCNESLALFNTIMDSNKISRFIKNYVANQVSSRYI